MNIIPIVMGFVFWAVPALALAGGPALTPVTTPAPALATATGVPAPAASGVSPPSGADAEAGSVAYDAGNYDKARRIWEPLAKKGDIRAQRGMGKLYEKGRGVDRDFAVALKWYRPAAEQGDAESQYRLAVGYAYGLGIKKDEAAAAAWLQKAAANGQKRAQKSLARAYEDGLFGLPRDPAQAKYWYDKANGKSGS